MTERYEEILEYWFGAIPDLAEKIPAYMEARLELWFGGAPETDASIRERFEPDLLRAENFDCERWEDQPRSALALVILFDQFPRNIYRVRPRGIAFDRHALRIAEESIQKGFDLEAALIERAFFYMPFMHSESLEVEERGVKRFAHLRNAAPAEWKSVFANFHHYAELHLQMIERFGRFPDRNEMLGRESTPEEIEVLKNYPF